MIPKLLHFIWIGDERKRPNNCIQTWVDRNPGWNFRIWGNDDLFRAAKWFNANHMMKMWDVELCGVADMMRWEILYRHGGVAVDADSVCVRGFDDWILETEAFACWENELKRHGLIATCALGSTPKNPFIGKIVDDILAEPSVTHDAAWKTVGPLRLTTAFHKYKYTPLTIFPSHFFIPDHFCGTRYQGSGLVYARQEWGSTNRSYDTLHLKRFAERDVQESQASTIPRAIELVNQGRADQAETICREILHHHPFDADALQLLGMLEWTRGNAWNALEFITQSLQINPNQPIVHSNLSGMMVDRKMFSEALKHSDQAILLKPNFALAHYNRGCALLGLQRPSEALQSFDQALALQPNYAKAMNNRGNALQNLHRLEEALACYKSALKIDDNDAGILNNLGNALLATSRFEEAADVFHALLQRFPNVDYALGNLLVARLHCCDWREYSDLVNRINQGIRQEQRVCTPFWHLYLSDSPDLQLYCARIFAEDQHPSTRLNKATRNNPRSSTKIRLAYLSSDFHDHATAILTAGLFEAHNRDQFEVFAISFGPDDGSEMRTRLVAAFDAFIDVRDQSDNAVAQLIMNLDIDIAVDLKGYTARCRPGILAYEPARININYLGYPGTMGAAHIHYILADEHIIPPSDQRYYIEQIIYLPNSYQINDNKREIAETIPTREQMGLPSDGFVFCCFNRNHKIVPEIFEVWMRVLAQTPGSVLWLLHETQRAADNLRREAAMRGISPDRLVFAKSLEPKAHLARLSCADLVLDTLPYNAHTTASDALWVSVPVLTCKGSTFAGRVASSLLHATNTQELITQTLDEYERVAVQLACEPNKIADIRSRLALNRMKEPLFDTRATCRYIESAFTTIMQRFYRGESPVSFAIKDTK